MNQCNRGAGNHFRERNGNPRDEVPNMRPVDLEKRHMAIEHDVMAADVMLSITDWLLEGAIKGKQRHFYIENPTKSNQEYDMGCPDRTCINIFFRDLSHNAVTIAATR